MIVGREAEIKQLRSALSSNRAEMVAVIGRRRVGKTFLIDEVYGNHIVFQQTGVRHAPVRRQLRTFANNLALLNGGPVLELKDWLDAFFQLRQVLEQRLSTDRKIVIFFDELSWLATPAGEFLDYLAHFWNDWAHRQNLVLVLCGSVSSWIIKRVINDKGGLHNRVTRYLHLKPFTLAETAEFLEGRHFHLPPRQVIELYLCIGGIPLYLEDLQPGMGLHENLDRLCFQPTGLLREEFNRLYSALFNDARLHTEVIRTLAASPRGLTRTQLITGAGLPNGGKATQVLEELEQSDFIQAQLPYKAKKNGKVYRLVDEYSLFYLRFIEGNKLTGRGTWLQLSQRQTFRTWAGYAFESVCLKHVQELKAALGIAGVHTTAAAFHHRGGSPGEGFQIDLLLERADGVINLCEMKFYRKPYTLTKTQAEVLDNRREKFLHLTGTRHHVISTLILPAPHQPGQWDGWAGIRTVDATRFLRPDV